MTYLPDLKRQLVEAVEVEPERAPRWRRVPARLRPRGPRHTLRGVPLVAVLALTFAVLTAVALAASGVIQIGAPVKTPYYAPSLKTPNRGMGAVVPGSVRLLDVRTPDPAGGPPWGMRVFQTTRGLACVQVGRIVAGRIGLLGQDGIAADDGRFHPLPVRAVDLFGCVQADARGHAFTSVDARASFASGPSPSRACSAPGQHDPHKHVACPEADQRTVAYGLLGPDGRSVTYRVGRHGSTHTVAASSSDGAYLIVVRDHAKMGGTSVGAVPGSPPIRSYTYANGRVCHVPGPPRCGPVGYAPASVPHLSSAQMRERIAVHARRAIVRHTRVGVVDLSFPAPVAIANAASGYVATVRLPCGNGSMMSAESSRNVSRGERVHIRLMLSRARGCSETVRGDVRLRLPNRHAGNGMMPFTMPGTGPLVGRFRVP